MDPMEAIKITFFQECEEQLAELESGLLAMEAGEADAEVVNAVFRAVHSIKGGAGAFGLDDLVRFAHVFETTLDEVRTGKRAPDPDLVLKPMLRAADILADLVRAARDGGVVDAARVQQSAEELNADGASATEDEDDLDSIDFGFAPLQLDTAEDETPVQAAAQTWIVCFRPKADLYAKANEAGLLIRELGLLGEIAVEIDASALPVLEALDPEGAYLAWTVMLTTERCESDIWDVFEFVDGDCDIEIRRAEVGETADGDPSAPPENAPAEEAFDVMALIRKVQTDIQPEAPAPAAAANEPPVSPPTQLQAQVEPAPANAPAAPVVNGAGSTIRVDLERVDRLIDLVGELVINQAMLSQRVMEAGIAGASAIGMGLDELEQLSREIQDSVMAIRAQPVKSVFQRMPRLAREVAAMTGKLVRLVTDGEGTEVDKTVIERLADPLTHMIRNAIDHGLERPEARVAAGKSPEGIVRLSAGHRSGRIVIEIADDGAGINRPKVRDIAVQRGLIATDANLSDDEIDNLIFLPGFSTATEVTDVSGRGVGMDVVKRSIQALGGRISISSRPGKGSTFIMSLPLTLAVLDGMVVSLGEQTLVVPLTAIVETLQPKAGDVYGMGGEARVIAVRESYVPLIDVGQVLDYRQGAMPAGEGGRAPDRGGWWLPGRASGGRHPGPAPSGDQEPRSQLSPCARHRRRDHPWGRPRGPDPGRGRGGRRLTHGRTDFNRTQTRNGGLIHDRLSEPEQPARRRPQSERRRSRTDHLPHRGPRVLRGHHVRAGDPRLDQDHRLATIAHLRPGCGEPSRRGAADRRSVVAARVRQHRPDRTQRHHRHSDQRATGGPPGRCGLRHHHRGRRRHPADPGCDLRTGKNLRAGHPGHRRAHDQPDLPGSRAARPPTRSGVMAPVADLSGRPGQDPLVEGEFLFTIGDFRAIAAMLHGDAGIALPESKATLVYSRLAKRLRLLGLESFRDYCALVASAEGGDERVRMLAALTTNVTRFFREPHHFEHLKTHVLPPLIARAKAGGRVRLWSAACSSGQEPYSIALSVLSLMPDAANYDIKILASDIDPNIVAEARFGVYGEAALEPVPAPLRDRWFTPVVGKRGESSWSARDEVRDLVSFRELNLIGDWPMKGKFQAIFCRNVVIYFNDDTQAKVWSRFTPLLETGGVLYIGHSERVSGPAAAQLQPSGITTYALKPGGGR